MTLLVLVVLLEDQSRLINPALLPMCLRAVCVPALLVDYVIRLARRPTAAGRSATWRWAVFPLAMLLQLSSELDPWPLRARFALSRAAFEEALVRVRNEQPVPAWVGLFPVSSAYHLDNGVVGFVVGCGFMIELTAVCFDPSHPEGHRFNRDLGGGWYAREP